MKFRFYIVDEYSNVSATNDEEWAKKCAEDDLVIDVSRGKVLPDDADDEAVAVDESFPPEEDIESEDDEDDEDEAA